MSLWRGEEIAQVTGGALLKDFSAESVSIDSRTAEKGALFIAIKGENFDGHSFVKDVLARGAAGAIVSHVPEGLEDAPLVKVADTQKALEALGQASRRRTAAKIVAVTGSVGKTSTKEMLRTILTANGTTHATTGNFNNHIGLPLSLSRMPEQTQFGVFELGMNHAGEISALTTQLHPNVAIITAVEAVHLEFFDSVEGIAYAKAEIFEGLEKGGAAVLPLDNPYFAILKAEAEKYGAANIITFGEKEGADYQLISYSANKTGSEIRAKINGREVSYTTGMLGKHQAVNSLAALAGSLAAGADEAKAIAALKNAEPAKGRGRLQQVRLGEKNITVLDDSYNASPASMRAAFAVVAEVAKATGGRAVAALGDMRELGTEEKQLHVGLKDALLKQDIKQVFTAGVLMQYLQDALPEKMKAGHVDAPLKLRPLLEEKLQENDVLLIKSSNGSLMWKLAESLVENKVGV